MRLLQTVKGVGPRLAETVVACLDDVSRFKSANQVGSYAGLVPKQMESGDVKRIGRITHAGPRGLLRGMLVEVAWMVYRHNAWAKSFVLRVSRGMKTRKRIAIVAVLARKLLIKLWAMLRDGTPWRDPDGEGSSEDERKEEEMRGPYCMGRRRGPLRKTPDRVLALSSVVGVFMQCER